MNHLYKERDIVTHRNNGGIYEITEKRYGVYHYSISNERGKNIWVTEKEIKLICDRKYRKDNLYSYD